MKLHHTWFLLDSVIRSPRNGAVPVELKRTQLATEWQVDALCRGVTHLFFGPSSERPERRAEREAVARSYCMVCPVKLECRESARLQLEHGFWGGENDEERAAAGFVPRSPSRRAVLAARSADQ